MPSRRRTPTTQPSNADLLLWMAEAEQYRRSFRDFAQAAWPILEPGTPLKWARFHDAICLHLQALAEGQIHRLAINIAPGHSKSTLVSQMFPMWLWTRQPTFRWLCASTSLDLAIRDNRNSRFLVESDWYRQRWGREFRVTEQPFDMSSDINMKSFFENDQKGYRLSLGIGSRGVGKRADGEIIDDPHDPMEGDAQRQEVLGWYSQTWVSRLNDQEHGLMLLIGQRLRSNDLFAHVLALGGFEHLSLPEEFEPTRKCFTAIGWKDWRTTEGELLWPEKFPPHVLRTLKQSLGTLGYVAQYQQLPSPAGGLKFQEKWFRYFTETDEAYLLHRANETKSFLKSQCWKFGTVDLAISKKTSADYTVMGVWAVTPERDLLLLHLFRDRVSDAESLAQLTVLHGLYQPSFWKFEVAFQEAIFNQALRKGIPCRPYRPDMDKERRATTAAVWMENEKTFLPKHALWLDDCKAELLSFPKGEHDDIVDNFSMAALEISAGSIPLQGDEVPDPQPEPSLIEAIKAAQVDPFLYAESLGMWGND